MPKELFDLFWEQSFNIYYRPYKNEFETMRMLFEEIPKENREAVQNLSLKWIQDLEDYENTEFDLKDVSEKVKESKDLRHKGNKLFTGTGNRNILGACSLYNDAINAALDTDGQELALSFANRGMALQTFGYYQQAYDDCVYALRLGYPASTRHKIILRLAFCAIKLKYFEKADAHFEELKLMNLNSNCLKQYKDLEAELQNLRKEHLEQKLDSKIETVISFNRESQEIITNTEKGRFMIATCAIEKNDLIFTERIQTAVVIGDSRRICQQCLTVNFIPYPCLHCRGRVNYCSIKCQDDHANVHIYECRGYRFQLFAHIGIAHLALRVMLDNGIFSVVDKIITSEKSTTEVWYDLLNCGNISNDNNITTYAESLKMITHLDKESDMNKNWFALVSVLLVVYLKHYTDYFKKLNEKSNKINWEILTGSLIFRHIGQSISNAFNLITIIPKPISNISNTEYHMLNEKIWLSPWNLKLGYLNQFGHYDNVAAINLPYTSLCNHSCVQSFQPRFSGRYLSTYALRNFSKGDEITNCYGADNRKSKRSDRRKELKETYHFDCKCEDCLKTTAEDVEFNKFHQYRCDNRACEKLFVPNIPENPTLNWWNTEIPNESINVNIYCTVCGCLQNISWYHEFKQLLNSVFDSNTRRRQYYIFKKLENTLVGLNKARGFFAMRLVNEWLNLSLVNTCLNNQDYLELIEMVKYLQKLYASICSEISPEYVAVLSFLWDLIALRKYKCSKADMDKMLLSVNILDDITKQIFINYYNDYIKDLYIKIV